MLSVNGLAYAYEMSHRLFSAVNLTLAGGDYVAIMGESGAGKSTLLNLIAGLDRPTNGTIDIDGIDIGKLDDDALTLLRRRQLGFVFQAFHVLPYLTVAQNVGLPLRLLRIDAALARTRIAEMIEAVGLSGKEARPPRELSGGELQRVAIARALVHRPRLVLADEPTGNLDAETAKQILELLAREIARNGAAGILVTHSQLAAASAQRIYRLSPRGLAPAVPAPSALSMA